MFHSTPDDRLKARNPERLCSIFSYSQAASVLVVSFRPFAFRLCPSGREGTCMLPSPLTCRNHLCRQETARHSPPASIFVVQPGMLHSWPNRDALDAGHRSWKSDLATISVASTVVVLLNAPAHCRRSKVSAVAGFAHSTSKWRLREPAACTSCEAMLKSCQRCWALGYDSPCVGSLALGVG